MDAKVIIPLAAIGVAGLYVYMKFRTDQQAQEAIMEGLRNKTITEKDIVSVTDEKTTFLIGGKKYTVDNKVLGSTASKVGQWAVDLVLGWLGKKSETAKKKAEEGKKEEEKKKSTSGDAMAGYSSPMGTYAFSGGTPRLGDATRSARGYALSRGFWKPRTFEPAAWGGAPRNLCIVDT